MLYELKPTFPKELIQYQDTKPSRADENPSGFIRKRRLANSETSEVIEFTEKDLEMIYQMSQDKLSDMKNPKEFQLSIMKYGVENAHQLLGLILFDSIESRDIFLNVYARYDIPYIISKDGLTVKSTSDRISRVLECMTTNECGFIRIRN
jgi:hypothetical protein